MKDFESLTVISVEYYCLVNMLENDLTVENIRNLEK